jgi:long-chain acyl-CoA synthetase
MVGMGGKIGFYQGDIKKLVDDMKEVKPTIFCTVPRLLNRIYAKVNTILRKKQLFFLSFVIIKKNILKPCPLQFIKDKG